jgi:hypothetical protein
MGDSCGENVGWMCPGIHVVYAVNDCWVCECECIGCECLVGVCRSDGICAGSAHIVVVVGLASL